MGAQQACHCGRGEADADDRDADSPVLAVADAPGELAANSGAGGSAPSAGEAPPRPAPEVAGEGSGQQSAPEGALGAAERGADRGAATRGRAEAVEARPGQEVALSGGVGAAPRAQRPRPKRAPSTKRSGTGKGRPGAPTTSAGGAEECPGMKLAAAAADRGALTPIQKVERRRAEEDRKAKEMLGTVDDILAGKYQREGTQKQPAADLRIRMPTPYERENTRKFFLETFRSQYQRLGEMKESRQADERISQYGQEEVDGLTIKDGHRAMPRPAGIKLPKDFRHPVGLISLATLKKYSCDRPRKLISVYGDIFDVSDRPDKYGKGGPYSWMTGNDISWGFVSGRDTPDEINKFYDMWKIAPESLQQRKLTGLLAWVAFYSHEYGGMLGRLKEYENEAAMKGPPMEECEECCIM